MSVKKFRSLWGISPVKSWQSALFAIKSDGFDGIEASLQDLNSIDSSDFFHGEIKPILAELKLELIIGVYSSYQDYESYESKSVDQHVEQICRQLLIAASMNPFKINCHSGQDSFTFQQSHEYLEKVLEFQAKNCAGILISHETHRSRIFYSPWTTLELSKAFPTLLLTIDFSHWVVVTERLLDHFSDKDWLASLVERVSHIHARVGSAQSSQITHPNDAIWWKEVERFDSLWLECCRSMKDRGISPSACVEYGPSPYTPYKRTGEPAVDVDTLIREQVEKWNSFYIEGVN